ncbi:MAG: two-component regulator propeller domain-containing protein [Thermoanaerobaculia bacterium]
MSGPPALRRGAAIGRARRTAGECARGRRGRPDPGGLGRGPARDRRRGRPVLRPVAPPDGSRGLFENGLETVAVDDEGLWAGGVDGAYRWAADGTVASLAFPRPPGTVRALLRDRRGRHWIGADAGLFLGRAGSGADRIVSLEAFAGLRVRSLHEAADGTIWVGVAGGLLALAGGEPQAAPRRFGVANGMRDETVNAMTEDPAGNLWLATDIGGALRLARAGLVTFDTPDGLGHTSVTSIFEARDGSLHASGQIGGWINRFDGGRFVAARPRVAPAVAERLRRTATQVRQRRDGSWWMATREGLYRYPPTDRIEELERRDPVRRFGPEEGLPSARVHSTFEDSRGRLWVVTARSPLGTLSLLLPGEERFRTFGEADGVPVDDVPTAFLEAPEGTVWVGWDGGGLVRGEGERFRPVALPVRSTIAALLHDRSGGLWVATEGEGLWHTTDPSPDRPVWRHLASADGLASDDGRCLVEDRLGGIYFGSVNGVDRLDAGSDALRHYSTADGLAQLETTAALRDRDGSLWFATYGGVSRLVPEPEPRRDPPPVWIAGLWVDDRPMPVPTFGTAAAAPIELPFGRHRVRIDFHGPSFVAGERLHYQLRDGEASDWSPPSAERSVVFAGLGSGRHGIEVRAVDVRGERSVEPARAVLFVRPPFWHRGWFFAAVGLSLAALGIALHRLRVQRAVELERVRTRIAADLHDDLGASLARISLLAELARADRERAEAPAETLRQIADTARGLTGRAREIVWSLDPRHDNLASFAVRVRELTGELLDPGGIAWTLAAPPADEARRIVLRPELRRHLLLLFKEAVHNAQRHSGAQRIDLRLGLEGRMLVGAIVDDGCGLPEEPREGSGQGLGNLRQRIGTLGGSSSSIRGPGRDRDPLLGAARRRRPHEDAIARSRGLCKSWQPCPSRRSAWPWSTTTGCSARRCVGSSTALPDSSAAAPAPRSNRRVVASSRCAPISSCSMSICREFRVRRGGDPS